MHVILVLWRPGPHHLQKAASLISRVGAIYPTLDERTAWCAAGGTISRSLDLDLEKGRAGECCVLGLHHAPDALGARQVRHVFQDHVVFLDGTPVDPSGEIAAHRAEDVGPAFDRIPDLLEGRFLIGRWSRRTGAVDLVVDPVGMCPLYRAEDGRTVGYSNNVDWLRRTMGLGEMDSTGAALALARGWVGLDRTLVEGVRVVPGGTLIRLDSTGERTTRYFNPCALAMGRDLREPLTPWVDDVVRVLPRMAHAASLQSPLFECQLTGGYDSRLVAAACRAAGTNPRFMTRGTDDHADVQLAARLCAEMGVDHDLQHESVEYVVTHFERASARLIEQNDGLVSLWQVNDAVSAPSAIDLLGQTLGGALGGVRRGVGLKKGYRLAGDDPVAVLAWMVGRVGAASELLREEAVDCARREVRGALEQLLAAGVRPRDLGYVDYLTDRMRRWGGSNARKVEPERATLPILASRAFLRSSFAQSEEEGRRLTVHLEAISRLAPELLRVPFDKPVEAANAADRPRGTNGRSLWERLRSALKGASSSTSRLGEIGHTGPRARVLARVRASLRERVLDRQGSPVFDLVDRGAFERLTSEDGFSTAGSAAAPALYAIATLREYEERVLLPETVVIT